MSGGCVVLVPVLNRPHRAAPVVGSVRATSDARVLFLCTPGDTVEIAAVKETGADWLVLDDPWAPGDYARKINTGYRQSDEPLLFLGADDLDFHPGWLEAASGMLSEGRVVGTNDLGSPRVMAGRHATHSLVARSYIDEYGTIDRPGRVLHEGYKHCFVDDEFVGTAKHRGEWAFAFDSHVEHLHADWGKSPHDHNYTIAHQSMVQGRRLFLSREPLWT